MPRLTKKLETKASVEALNEEAEARQNADAEFESSLEASERNVQSLANELRFLEDRVSELSKTNPEVVVPTAGEPTTISDPTKDVIIQSNFDNVLTVTAKSVEIKDAEITANSKQSILLNVSNEAALKDSTVACNTASNTNVVMITNAQYITFRNMTFTGRTFNLPNFTDRVIQGAGTRGNIGDYISESLPNFNATFQSNLQSGQTNRAALTWNQYATGTAGITPLNTGSLAANTSGINIVGGCTGFTIDLSDYAETYQNNAPVQQQALLIQCCIKY